MICLNTTTPATDPTPEPVTPEPTESPTVYCYGVEYTHKIGGDFEQCANRSNNEVLIKTCREEHQRKLEFAIANHLYEFCGDQCVYFSMELAFRWIRYRKCYDAIYNTGSEWLCWVGAYNNFYAN